MTVNKQMDMAAEKIEKALGYSFGNRELLLTALTHSSFANEAQSELTDNERLEFLGDAVLDLVISEYLHKEFSQHDEGALTQARADVVAMPSLAELARGLDLGAGLLLGKGEERSGGRNKSSLLADALESVFGAIFLDNGYDAAKATILPLFVPLLQNAFAEGDQDYKSRLQELMQAQQRRLPEYQLVETEGPDHARTYHVCVVLEDTVCGSGHGRTKKAAEQAAAKVALDAFGL